MKTPPESQMASTHTKFLSRLDSAHVKVGMHIEGMIFDVLRDKYLQKQDLDGLGRVNASTIDRAWMNL